MAYTIFIRGIPENPQVVEVRVHVAPGVNTAAPFRIPVGTAITTCSEVKPDPARDAFNGQVYKWFKLTFSDGRSGWVRDDLLDLQGDCSAFAYGSYPNRTLAFSAVVPVSVSAPAVVVTVEQPAAPTTTPTISQPTSQPPASSGCAATIRSDTRAKLRAGPGTNSAQVDALYAGTQIPVQDVVAGQDGQIFRWIKTSFNGKTGYIREDLLSFGSGCEALGLGNAHVPTPVVVTDAAKLNQQFRFESPLKVKYRIFQEFGDTKFGTAHKGTDLTTPDGGPDCENGPIFATGSGFVHLVIPCTKCTDGKPNFASQGIAFWDSHAIVDRAWGYGFGNHVIVRYAWADLPAYARQELTGQNLVGVYAYVIYAHMNRIDVKQGDKISDGTQLGILGNTGNSSGAHLHVEAHFSLAGDEQDYFHRLLMNPRIMFTL